MNSCERFSQHNVINDCLDADVESYKNAMRMLAGGVTVVTVGGISNRTGMTATSVTSLSVEPPTLLFSLDSASSTWSILKSEPWFCVNILTRFQEQIARDFTGFHGLSGEGRYREGEWKQNTHGTFMLRDAIANINCVMDDMLTRRTHHVILGRVTSVIYQECAKPLVYWNQGFRDLASE